MIKVFPVSKIPKYGTISIYGNFLGKPIDNISYIKNIFSEENNIKINFTDGFMIIKQPTQIILDLNSIEIDSDEPVIFKEEIFEKQDGEKAFVLYKW